MADETIWDQNGFNDLVRKQLGPSVDDESGLVYAYDGNLKLGLLPASIFCSGHTYFVQVHNFSVVLMLLLTLSLCLLPIYNLQTVNCFAVQF